MPHFTGNYSPLWTAQEQQFSQALSKNINSRVEYPPHYRQEVGHLGLELEDKGSPSTQSSSHSPHGLPATGKANSQDQCVSSQPVQTQSYQKRVEEQVTSAFLMSNPEFPVNSSQIDMNQSTISFAAYSDPYFSGFFNGYGPQAIIQSQMVGMAPGRIPLPPDLAQDGPIYVNARQYRGILRRRQIRAKLEAQNKLVKNRKPYLHESRHRHAVNRVRGSGGRFLSKKQQPSVGPTPTSDSKSASVLSHQDRNIPVPEVKPLNASEHDASAATSSMSIGNMTNGNFIFRQPDNMISSVSSQMALSMSGAGGFLGSHEYRRHSTPSFR